MSYYISVRAEEAYAYHSTVFPAMCSSIWSANRDLFINEIPSLIS